MFFERREAAVVTLLRDEVAYLRGQIEAGREREDRLRHEVITLASSRAAAEISFYDRKAHTAPVGPAAMPSPWPPPRQERSVGPFDNHLGGGGHMEESAPAPLAHGEAVDEDALAEATIERVAKEREEERLRLVHTVADA